MQDDVTYTYTYDSDGLRLTKTVGTGNSAVEHRYTWQGGKLISETWDGKKIEYFYGPEGSIDGFTYKAGPNSSVYAYYYIKNLQGDVVAVVNTNGELRAEYTYDPFGKVLSATGTMADINPIRYRGYYYDQELGFYYLQSRYYDPNLCRFINADGLASTGQGFLGCNMFAYCNNDPVNMLDQDGQEAAPATYVPESYIFDAARAIGSAALAAGLLAASCFLHRASAVYGRNLLAALSKKSSSTTSTSASSSSPASPPEPGNNRNKKGKDYVEARNNRTANEWARKAGAEDAETLKEYYTGKQGSRFNIVRNRETGQLILRRLSDGLEIPTEYYLLR